MTPDLALDADERLIAQSVSKFCTGLARDTARTHSGHFDRTSWRSFCQQGFFALGTPEGEGGARMVVACAESLGGALFAGPVFDTFLAVQVLAGQERTRVIEGELIASCGVLPILPFAMEAQLHLGLAAQRVTRLKLQGSVETLPSLSGEPWGRVSALEAEPLPHAGRGLFFFDLALAAYMTAAARSLLTTTAEHVATRKQFGRAVGSFQAVAHPLASCHIALSAAQTLARAAAATFDEHGPRARTLATAAVASSRRAALDTAYTCHQKLGAIGITIEGPAHHITRRLRQLAARAAERTSQEPALVASFGG